MSAGTALIHGDGTPERAWRGWKREFPALDLTGCRRLVVVAPHPDDEVLGVGGLMAVAAAAAIEVRVLAVTDGAASHPGSPTTRPAELARVRPQEAVRALAVLGLPTAPTRLGVPDGQVAEHEDEVAKALRSLLADDAAGTWCLATARFDGHPDHETTGRAAAAACTATGARLLEYPVWMWHWAQPDDNLVPWGRARRIALPSAVAQFKATAAQCFRSQIEALSADPADAPVLPAHVLARLLRSWELVFT